jgi:hypothetical protein
MKVIYNLKNMKNKEFQHSLESKLIEVMKMKMQMIQLVSNVNLIQTQSTQAPHLFSKSQIVQLADTTSESQSSPEPRHEEFENHSVHKV